MRRLPLRPTPRRAGAVWVAIALMLGGCGWPLAAMERDRATSVSVPDPHGDTTATLSSPRPEKPRTALRLPTMGGSVWWIDVWRQDGYRIQTHKILGVRRLIDPANALIAMGSFETCQEALARELALAPEDQAVNWNLPILTMGGVQFWGDEMYCQGWKIQKNTLTGHFRLLDPDQTRRAWGTWPQCLRELRRLAPPPPEGDDAPPLVFLIHGILLGTWSFEEMGDRLSDAGYAVCRVAYPSTQASIAEHAAQLNRLLDHLEGYGELYLVGHSMGGLIARTALHERADPRVRSLITLGTPHTGAVPADILKDWYPFQVVFGPSGQQLVTGAQAFAARLPPPPVPMGCIAGGKGNGKGYNPLLPGDNDGTVTVESALYAGASDTLVVPALHSFMMSNDQVIAAVIAFLQEGRFRRP